MKVSACPLWPRPPAAGEPHFSEPVGHDPADQEGRRAQAWAAALCGRTENAKGVTV